VHRFADAAGVDWNPLPIDVEPIKQTISLNFQKRVAAALASAR